MELEFLVDRYIFVYLDWCVIILAQVTSEVSSLALLIKLLIFTLLVGIYSNIAARIKGRNVAAWTIIGFIPIVNFFSSLLLLGSTNLKATFGGRNVGKIAKSIAYHHNRLGSFEEVIQIYLSHFDSLEKFEDSNESRKKIYAVMAIKNSLIKNYRDLAALTLLVCATPPSYNFNKTVEKFGKELETRLQKHGLSNELASGNALDA